MSIKIRKASPQDQAFIVEAQLKMALETEDLVLQKEVVLKGVDKIIDKPCLGQYFIAQIDDDLVGCLLIQYEWSDWRNGWVIWVHSVFVDPKYRKAGVFKRLLEHVRQVKAKDGEVLGIRLFVDKSNLSACKVYDRMGMTNEHYHLYELMF